MPNDIPQRQILPEFIDRIAASSQAYGIVKTITKAQTILALTAAISGPLAAFALPAARPWVAAYAVMILLIDVILLEPAIKRYQELGAKIQESFDTDLFRLPWNSHRCDGHPDREAINNLATKFKKTESTDRLVAWYPTSAGALPLEFGRLVCQRANMRWDAAMRRHYAMFFIALILLMVLAVIVVALFKDWDASQIILSLLLPLLPSALKLVREYRKHVESAAISERTKALLESIWDRALTERLTANQLLEDSRRLQDELFDRRKSSPTIPQWIYLRLRDQYELDMSTGSEQMVNAAKEKLGIAS